REGGYERSEVAVFRKRGGTRCRVKVPAVTRGVVVQGDVGRVGLESQIERDTRGAGESGRTQRPGAEVEAERVPPAKAVEVWDHALPVIDRPLHDVSGKRGVGAVVGVEAIGIDEGRALVGPIDRRKEHALFELLQTGGSRLAQG